MDDEVGVCAEDAAALTDALNPESRLRRGKAAEPATEGQVGYVNGLLRPFRMAALDDITKGEASALINCLKRHDR